MGILLKINTVYNVEPKCLVEKTNIIYQCCVGVVMREILPNPLYFNGSKSKNTKLNATISIENL